MKSVVSFFPNVCSDFFNFKISIFLPLILLYYDFISESCHYIMRTVIIFLDRYMEIFSLRLIFIFKGGFVVCLLLNHPGCALSNPALQNILFIYCFWSYSIFLLILVTFDFGYSIFTSFSLNIFNYFKLCVHVRTCTRLCMYVSLDAGAGRGIGFLRPAITDSSKPPNVDAGI